MSRYATPAELLEARVRLCACARHLGLRAEAANDWIEHGALTAIGRALGVSRTIPSDWWGGRRVLVSSRPLPGEPRWGEEYTPPKSPGRPRKERKR